MAVFHLVKYLVNEATERVPLIWISPLSDSKLHSRNLDVWTSRPGPWKCQVRNKGAPANLYLT